jgi:hypothetical protein
MLTRPSLLLKLDYSALLLIALAIYYSFQFSWTLFAILFLAPDLFMLGYLANPRFGSALYNLGHTFFTPLILFAISYLTHRSILLAIAIIWISHIAFDRILGYGLKYPTHFKDTHLQRV